MEFPKIAYFKEDRAMNFVVAYKEKKHCLIIYFNYERQDISYKI